jgi:hypothetical protein
MKQAAEPATAQEWRIRAQHYRDLVELMAIAKTRATLQRMAKECDVRARQLSADSPPL